MTDIADDPANAPSIVQPEPTREMVLGATDQLPATSPPWPMAPPATTVIPTAESPTTRRRLHRVRSPVPSSSTTSGRKVASSRSTVAVVLLLVAIGALAIAGWALTRTKSYTVPDLVGVQEEVALNEISGNEWTIEREIWNAATNSPIRERWSAPCPPPA